MNPELSLKIRVASGMAVVLAVIAGTVALRSHHSTSVAQIAQPSAAVASTADAPAAVVPFPDAPAAVAPIPDAPVAITIKDSVGAKTGDAARPAGVEPKVASNRYPAKAHSSADTTETLDKKRVDGVNSAREQMMPSAASGTAIDAQEAPKSDELAALDGVITTEVKSQLAADTIGKDVDIGVTTTHGIVVLTGTVLTLDAIDHARGVAEKVKDVKSVDTSAMMIPAT
jgi:hyperosmotically inducible periplasmic protein